MPVDHSRVRPVSLPGLAVVASVRWGVVSAPQLDVELPSQAQERWRVGPRCARGRVDCGLSPGQGPIQGPPSQRRLACVIRLNQLTALLVPTMANGVISSAGMISGLRARDVRRGRPAMGGPSLFLARRVRPNSGVRNCYVAKREPREGRLITEHWCRELPFHRFLHPSARRFDGCRFSYSRIRTWRLRIVKSLQ